MSIWAKQHHWRLQTIYQLRKSTVKHMTIVRGSSCTLHFRQNRKHRPGDMPGEVLMKRSLIVMLTNADQNQKWVDNDRPGCTQQDPPKKKVHPGVYPQEIQTSSSLS